MSTNNANIPARTLKLKQKTPQKTLSSSNNVQNLYNSNNSYQAQNDINNNNITEPSTNQQQNNYDIIIHKYQEPKEKPQSNQMLNERLQNSFHKCLVNKTTRRSIQSDNEN